jgi:hypothetical protein
VSHDRAAAIRDTVQDLVDELLSDGRKEDEELPRGAIEEAIAFGEISIGDIVGVFTDELIAKAGTGHLS